MTAIYKTISGTDYALLPDVEKCHYFPTGTGDTYFYLSPEELEEDLVESPAHYSRFPLQPAEFIMKNKLPWHVGNIVKYAVRAGYKEYADMTAEESEIKDLEKAIKNAQMRIDEIREEQDAD